MLVFFYQIIKDFGTFGAVLVSIGLNGFLFWKLFTNHLKHLAEDISDVKDTQEEMKNTLGETKERVSKIEGMLK